MKKLLTVILILTLLSIPYSVKSAKAETNVRVPVLLYHVVSTNPDPNNLYQFSLTEFKKHMDYLNANGYTTLSIDQYYNIINKKAPMPKKPVMLTFDDCTEDFYTNVYPILRKYHMKAAEFAITNLIDTYGHLTTSQLKTVFYNGIDVENHTTNHLDLTTLTHNQKYAAINNATAKIKSITNKAPLYLAYPYGTYDADSVSILKSLGYKAGFSVSNVLSTDTSNKYGLPRIVITNGDTLNVFEKKLLNGH
ncbi:peptidoglycan/xylan/chitin deacetylase (PgdA/CDA1 family) [Clostridium acetobutylicum]|uniref:Xylanase/chitin deacetylase family enzyme n=2 Tax=Clostridium acetobutylicum TaxID=1488 RepID=Q97TP4_CLOAB|nr:MULTISPECIES: polysaccharide deacetylase family protein [Clostridium]AAK76800.1 Xylanase/chitin deacetylase family enzyme [Clostridium acetobutylicum ATCC 824]ADZ22836.1 Xylanase/chitin deacetylase family enzyme [Clostridium acetobutylicum EA 2018]AEI34796.1 xylanase/chitin deacetylase family protein [Clostridium acetobutylicum DSM 1731]AWV82346.1 polysaccharide deacetylase family protein [Clostridium acetobutylicum]MBC2395812.1 polysaccharide deacetylase family protein [Clostridium acetobu